MFVLMLFFTGCASWRGPINLKNDYIWDNQINSDNTMGITVRGTRHIPYDQKKLIEEFQDKAAVFAQKVAYQVCPNGYDIKSSIPVDYQSEDCSKLSYVDIDAINEGKEPLPRYCSFTVYVLNIACNASRGSIHASLGESAQTVLPLLDTTNHDLRSSGEICSKVPIDRVPASLLGSSASTDNDLSYKEFDKDTDEENPSKNTGSALTKVAGEPVEKILVPVIDRSAIRKLLLAYIPQFRCCYQRELDANNNPDSLQGVINFRFFIAGGGKVNRSEITSNEFTSDKLTDCLGYVLNGIQFPVPQGGKTVEVNQPMNLFPKRK